MAIRRRPTLYAINLLVHSSFLFTIKALSFYLPVESENHASFKMTLLLGYNVFLLMMNDLLPSSSTSLISMAPVAFRRRKVGWGMAQTDESGQSEKRSWKRASFLGKEKIKSPGWCL